MRHRRAEGQTQAQFTKASFASLPGSFPRVETAQLCLQLGYRFIECKHSDVQTIEAFLSEHQCLELAIISGARILKADVIGLFTQGVVNFHPGQIPQTSGLDSFYWMIENQGLPGTTVHFIDHKVDAGRLIYFHECAVDADDTPTTLTARLYDNQLDALIRLLQLLKVLPQLEHTPINRLKKNQPMDAGQREQALAKFNDWRIEVLACQQRLNQVLEACEIDNQPLLADLLDERLVNARNNHGCIELAGDDPLARRVKDL